MKSQALTGGSVINSTDSGKTQSRGRICVLASQGQKRYKEYTVPWSARAVVTFPTTNVFHTLIRVVK